ncbi:glucosamine-6-phosphate deaminase, partial [Coprobacillus cateniformis]|nr:glucosamine-6-phosphate deaminase [Coprobacillus cateniformis]
AKKAQAVKALVEGPVDVNVPATILQKHPNVTVIVDKQAAALLTKK